MTPQEKEAYEMIKAVYDDGEAEINGRSYHFGTMVHKDRKKVFAFYTSVRLLVENNNFQFLDSHEFEKVETIINNNVLYNDSALSRLNNHWDKYPSDYVTFITTALAVISFPFLSVNPTD